MQLATALRKGPVQTQLLLGGVDKKAEGKDLASLYWMDYLGTLQQVTRMLIATSLVVHSSLSCFWWHLLYLVVPCVLPDDLWIG